ELLERARALASDACARFELAGQRTPRLEPLWTLARVALLRGDGEDARLWFEDLEDLAVATERPSWRERALLGSIGVARARGADFEVDRALRSLATFRDPGTCWALAREAAVQRLSEDEPERALELLDACPPSDDDPEIDARTAAEEWRALRIAAELRAGNVEAAGAALVETSAAPGTTAGEVTELAEVALLLDLGEPRRALARLDARRRGSGAASQRSDLGRTEALVLRGRALIALGRLDAAVAPLERAFEEGRRRDRERNLATAGALRDASAVGEWLGLSAVEALAGAHVLRGDPLRAGAAIEAAHAACSIEVAAERLVSLAGGTALGATTWIVGADGTTAVHVDADGTATGASIALGRREVARAVGRLRDALTETRVTGRGDRSAALGREIAETLLPAKVRRAIAEATRDRSQPGAAPTWAVLPHGALERMPFEALSVGARDRALGLDVAVAVVRSLREPGEIAAPLDGREARWTAFGAPDGEGFGTLVGARRELESLDALHPRLTAFVGDAFDRDRLARALSAADPVHVATHVVRAPTGASLAAPFALLTSGGRLLTANEVAGLAPRLPLLVLVACGSAEGPVVDGLGARGVAQAALDAGTRSAVVTLWPIGDAHGRTASIALHAALLAGASPAEAVRRARATLQRAGAPPSEWASYRLLGLP
ncbi:MAG: CHAT domain-containing protein, partial [Planctomycetota bacterium]